MCKNYERAELHWHSDYSNIRLLDTTNDIKSSILKANELGLKGMALTDHESLSGHMKALQLTKQLKKDGKIAEDFKMVLGNEIYLVESLEEVRDNYQPGGKTKFPHYLLIAKNEKGHEALRKLSSQAWRNSFKTGTMERVPTEMKYLEEIVKEYPNSLIASSACLGSYTSICILNSHEEFLKENIDGYLDWTGKLYDFVNWNISLYGKEDFYLELQPSNGYEQSIVNSRLTQLAKELELKTIITNDVHYLRPEDREIHKAYLNSKQDERETDSFYADTYLHENKEIFEKLDYLDESIIIKSFENTIEIINKCEDYSLEHETVIPITKLPEFKLGHLFEDGYNKYEFIKKFAYSKEEQDRYLLHLIEEGFMEFIYKDGNIEKEYFNEVLQRIDNELEQLWKISEKMNQAMSSYYVTTVNIVNLIWGDDCGDNSLKEGSLLGSGRGSAVAYLINFLIGITQVNPLIYGIEIPYWRHLNHEMGDVSSLDIDLDVTSVKKKYIYKRMRESYGEDRVLQVCTFGKEKPKSAINTACRGLGIDSDTAQYLGSFIPFNRGEYWSLNDCFYGNEEEDRKPISQFINEINKYPGLKETALKIEGLINKRSIHAGGVLILNDDYYKTNAIMRAPNGDLISQFNLDDSQASGSIKYDVLTIEACDKIQKSMELMLKNGTIEWQGTLRKTFNKYFHPESIDRKSKELFDTLGSGQVPDLFQFSTELGQSMIKKIKPSSVLEATAISSIIRLMPFEGGEQPSDTFLKHKKDISLWYKEMNSFGLNEKEINVFEKHLLKLKGVADSQESVMLMSMDENIGNFDLKLATKLRKLISKKKKDEALLFKQTIFEKVKEAGNRKQVAEYFWYQVKRMILYSFSVPHSLAYTLVAMQELNIFHHYNSLYWQTSCLTVNSGSQEVEEDEKSKDTNYGKVAAAIGKLKAYNVNVALPDINKSEFEFTPDIENDRIVYSLKGIVGVNDDLVNIIINNRPYSSFEDFYERLCVNYDMGENAEGNTIYGSVIPKSKMIMLIKAGCFEEFGDRCSIMAKYIKTQMEVKESLDLKNIGNIKKFGLLQTDSNKRFLKHLDFKEYIKKNLHAKEIGKGKNVILNENAYEFYMRNYSLAKEGEYNNGFYIVPESEVKKAIKPADEKLKELLNSKDFIKEYNIAQFYEIWDSIAEGTVEKWEMDSVSYYSNKHELYNVSYDQYGISNYFNISENPVIIGFNKYQDRQIPKYETYTIIGTVLDRNKNKHTISLLTPDGVVNCKMYSGSFAHYDKSISKTINGKKTTLEKSWFTRGNLIMVTGFRREDQFVVKSYAKKGQKKDHTIRLITEVDENGQLSLKTERNN